MLFFYIQLYEFFKYWKINNKDILDATKLVKEYI